MTDDLARSDEGVVRPEAMSGILSGAFQRAGLATDARFVRFVEVLAEEFVEDQYARLEEAGSQPEERIRLGQVFVDLGVTTRSLAIDHEASEEALWAMQLLVDPSRLDAVTAPPLKYEEPLRARCGSRVLLVGGPGQGKSTLGQHLVEFHRAALLRDLRERLDDPTREALDHDARERREEHRASVVRLPVRVALSRFAAWCVKNAVKSDDGALLRYVCERWRESLTPDEFARLLSVMPWVLVLDGLDEVPGASDRVLMMACIERFLDAHAERDPDHLVVATTRPQTWGAEFGGFLPLYLRALRQEEAIAYASALTLARYPRQPRQREKVDERIRAACNDSSSSQLMRTPLLVAIMTRLIAATGQAPRLRWDLFASFYDTIYDRELERDTTLSSVLADHRPIIDELHRHVGLVLQARSERDGGSAVSVSREWLRAAMMRLLEADDLPREVRERRSDEVFAAVEQRLVLLVAREGDNFAFELRSFQEFMAAWALTTGADHDVEERLKLVAPHLSWRNTSLLALGRLFKERSPHRERLSLGLCDWLDDRAKNPTWSTVQAGARLALDILHDGLAVHSARVLAGLAERALGVLDVTWGEGLRGWPNVLVDELLALRAAVDRDVMAMLRDAIEARLRDDPTHRGAWLAMIAAGPSDLLLDTRAKVLGEQLPLADLLELVEELADRGHPFRCGEERIEASWKELSPRDLQQGWTFSAVAHGRLRVETLIGWMVVSPLRPITPNIITSRGADCGHLQLFSQVEQRFQSSALKSIAADQVPMAWRAIQMAAQLLTRPEHETWVGVLRALGDEGVLQAAKEVARVLPWLLALIVEVCETADDLARVERSLRHEGSGLLERCQGLERRWGDVAFTPDSLRAWIGAEDPLRYVFSGDGLWCTAATSALFPDPETASLAQFKTEFVEPLLSAGLNAAGSRRRWLARLAWSWMLYAAVWGERVPLGEREIQFLETVVPTQGALWLRIGALARADVTAPIWAVRFSNPATLKPGWPESDFFDNPRPADWIKQVVETLRSDPRSVPAVVVLATLAQDLSAFDVPAVSLEDFDDPAVRACAAIVRMMSWSFRDDESDDLLACLVTPAWDAREVFVMWSERVRDASPRFVALLMTFLLANPPATLRGRGLAVLDQALLRTRSGLDEAETWRRLGLSDPTPERPTTAAPARVAADESEEVVTFDHIHVANLRGLEDIVLDAPSPEAGRGQWIVLLGENGSGKTTILRGVSLALTDRSNAAAVLGDARAPYVRTGEAQASCTVRLQGRDFKLTIKAREAGETVDPNGARGAWPWVVAYGCRRGGALGGNDPERARTRFADVATLFDDDRGLIGVESWLSLQHSAAREGDVQADIAYKTVVRVLERVLRFKTLPWRNDGLWVLANDGREVKFAALSDGYLTTAGWVVDLMVRYVERARGKVELKEDFNLRMVGVALVDEIDQHLHPRWQVRVIRELRELFSRMSFIVTTHNPLTLVGARREEVFILREGDAQKVTVEQARFDPRLRTGTELYAKFFGIDGLYPDELGRALHRYGLLASNPYRRDDEQAELDGIVKKLRDEGVDPGFDPEPRVSAS